MRFVIEIAVVVVLVLAAWDQPFKEYWKKISPPAAAAQSAAKVAETPAAVAKPMATAPASVAKPATTPLAKAAAPTPTPQPTDWMWKPTSMDAPRPAGKGKTQKQGP